MPHRGCCWRWIASFPFLQRSPADLDLQHVNSTESLPPTFHQVQLPSFKLTGFLIRIMIIASSLLSQSLAGLKRTHCCWGTRRAWSFSENSAGAAHRPQEQVHIPPLGFEGFARCLGFCFRLPCYPSPSPQTRLLRPLWGTPCAGHPELLIVSPHCKYPALLFIPTWSPSALSESYCLIGSSSLFIKFFICLVFLVCKGQKAYPLTEKIPRCCAAAKGTALI